MTLQITGDVKEIVELIEILQLQSNKGMIPNYDAEKYTYTWGDKPGSIDCISGSIQNIR